MDNRGMYVRSDVLLLFMAVLIFFPSFLAGETETPSRKLRIPKDPDVPAVDIKEKKDQGKAVDIPVTVETAKGDAMAGSIILNFDVLEIDIMDNGIEQKKAIPLEGIDSIDFVRWRGTERRKNEFVFYPSQTRITMVDKKIYECGRNIPLLNRLLFKNFKGNHFMYAYFYDYRKNNVWKNSGEPDMRYPEINPPAGTLLRIIFTKTGEKNILEKLLLK